MGFHMTQLRTLRSIPEPLSLLLAAAGAILIAFDAVEHHPALVMAGFSLLTAGVAVYFVGWQPPAVERRDLITTVPWAGAVLTLVYGLAAVLCLIAWAARRGLMF